MQYQTWKLEIRKGKIIYYIEFMGEKKYTDVLDNIVNTFEGRKIFE